MPENKKNAGGPDFLIRKLDCAVIQHIHKLNYAGELRPYDSVRGVFWEGDDLILNILGVSQKKEKLRLYYCSFSFF